MNDISNYSVEDIVEVFCKAYRIESLSMIYYISREEYVVYLRCNGGKSNTNMVSKYFTDFIVEFFTVLFTEKELYLHFDLGQPLNINTSKKYSLVDNIQRIKCLQVLREIVTSEKYKYKATPLIFEVMLDVFTKLDLYTKTFYDNLT